MHPEIGTSLVALGGVGAGAGILGGILPSNIGVVDFWWGGCNNYDWCYCLALWIGLKT